MLSKTISFSVRGIEGVCVHVEVDISGGLPSYTTVGLPDAAVREAKQRVVSAIRNSGFDFPSKKIVVSLAPGELRKEGTQLDLPIALGIISASGGSRPNLERYAFVGEVALDGSLRRVSGVLPMALKAREMGLEAIFVPCENREEAAAVGMKVYTPANLRQAWDFLDGKSTLDSYVTQNSATGARISTSGAPGAGASGSGRISTSLRASGPPGRVPSLRLGAGSSREDRPGKEDCTMEDFRDVRGQAFAKRALEIAAAGAHNVLLIGPPGVGKSMLASRLPTILPEMSLDEAIDVTRIHSVCGVLKPGQGLLWKRPFRCPHHTISDIALVGGGTSPRPGEVSLAHCGVLFLDEFPELDRGVLEVLRQPMEKFSILVSRAKDSATFPARFMLVAAMNPCPCGYLGHPGRSCSCTPIQVQRYRSKTSGPLLDRIDLHVELSPVRFNEWSGDSSSPEGETSRSIHSRVSRARQRQERRFSQTVKANAHMQSQEVRRYCGLGADEKRLLESAMDRFGFSARSLDRILKVARTIADLAGSEGINSAHLAEAVQYRTLDRTTGGIA